MKLIDNNQFKDVFSILLFFLLSSKTNGKKVRYIQFSYNIYNELYLLINFLKLDQGGIYLSGKKKLLKNKKLIKSHLMGMNFESVF